MTTKREKTRNVLTMSARGNGFDQTRSAGVCVIRHHSSPASSPFYLHLANSKPHFKRPAPEYRANYKDNTQMWGSYSSISPQIELKSQISHQWGKYHESEEARLSRLEQQLTTLSADSVADQRTTTGLQVSTKDRLMKQHFFSVERKVCKLRGDKNCSLAASFWT